MKQDSILSKFKLGANRNSIKTRLVVSFSILILLSSAIIGYISINRSSGTIAEEAEQSLSLLLERGVMLTQSRMETQKGILDTIASIEDVKSMDWERQQAVLQRQMDRTDFIDLGVVSLDGTTLYPNGDTAQLGDRDHVIDALAGKTVASDVIISRVTNEPIIAYAAPIKDGDKVQNQQQNYLKRYYWQMMLL